MSLIDDELKDIRDHCETHIEGSKIIACVPSMVRVRPQVRYYTSTKLSQSLFFNDEYLSSTDKTKYNKLTACLQFPDSYPKVPCLWKSKQKFQ